MRSLLAAVLLAAVAWAAPVAAQIRTVTDADPMPADQAAFVAAVAESRTAYTAADGELRKSLIRTQRGKRLAAALKATKGVVRGWRGEIEQLGTVGDGRAYIVIRIAPGLVVQTWNNVLSDHGDNTLIQQAAPIYTTMLDYKRGDKVIFGAVFKPDSKDGWREISMTEAGSMTEPAFLFKLGEIRRVP
jgi:hypothetical protein